MLAHVRAELLVELLVPPLEHEVQVELAQRRQERVRVAQRDRDAVRILDLELVLERQPRLGQQRLPEPGGVGQLRLDPGRLHAHGLSVGAKRAHDDPAVRLVRSQHGVRVGAEVEHHEAAGDWSISRRIPATGIPIQSGRLSSS